MAACIHLNVYMYIYIYRERKRERGEEKDAHLRTYTNKPWGPAMVVSCVN